MKKDGEITPPLKPPSHDVGLKLCDVVVALPTSSWFRSHLEEHISRCIHDLIQIAFQNLAEKMLGQQIDSATTFNDVKKYRIKEAPPPVTTLEALVRSRVADQHRSKCFTPKYSIIVQQCTKECEALHSFDGHDRAWLFPQHLKTWY